MVEIKQIENAAQKAGICDGTLRALPNWFGVEASIVAYVNQTPSMPFWAAFDSHRPVGFVALKEHNAYTSEIYVIGVLMEYHRQHIGQQLIQRCEGFCASRKAEFLTVKTLDESRQSQSYSKTRQFYQAMGFRPLEVFPLLWDEDNPCLFMAKHLAGV